MEDVTITLDDDTARRAREEAAARGVSLADFVRDEFTERFRPHQDQRTSLERILALPLLELSDENGRMPSREEMYAERTDQLLRRHEHFALPARPQGDGET